MELKDKIKALRTEQGLTQTQLAEKLFVSRSAVAKWENGLGLPNEESLRLLEELFGVTREQIATAQPETVIVAKNRRIRLGLIGSIAGWVALILLVIFLNILPFALHSGNYGFTPEMAAGSFADRPYIDTGDCRIYYCVFEGDWEDGRHWSDLQFFKVVQNHFWGSTVLELDIGSTCRIVSHNNYIVARLYSFKGKDGYYHILRKAKIYKAHEAGEPLVWDVPAELITATSVNIGSKEYVLEKGFFFVTDEPVEYFKIDGQWYDVE